MEIWIIRPSALGDTLMLMPSIRQVGASGVITLVGRSPGIDMIRPYVHHVIDYEGPGWHSLFMNDLEPLQMSPSKPPDCVAAFLVDQGGPLRANLEHRFPGSRVYLFPPFPPEGTEIHVALYLAQCLEKAGIPIKAGNIMEAAMQRPLLHLGDFPINAHAHEGTMTNERIRNRSLMLNSILSIPEFRNSQVPESFPTKERIIIHPGSGSLKKNLPPDFWLELIRRIRAHLSFGEFEITLLLGPAEERISSFFYERPGYEFLETAFSFDIQILLSVLGKAGLYLGHDSGVTHMAAMAGIPTVALFKNSSPLQWSPIGPKVRVLDARGPIPDLIEEILYVAKELLGATS